MIQRLPINEAPLTKLFNQIKFTIIVGAEKLIKPFAKYVALRYETEFFMIKFNDTGFAIQAPTDDMDKEEKVFLYAFDSVCTADKRKLFVDTINVLHQLSQESDTPHVVVVPCETHSQLRSLHFHLPEII